MLGKVAKQYVEQGCSNLRGVKIMRPGL